jgi:hypothetical protein
MDNNDDVKRIKVAPGLYILSLSGSSRGKKQMKEQARKAMKKVKEEYSD